MFNVRISDKNANASKSTGSNDISHSFGWRVIHFSIQKPFNAFKFSSSLHRPNYWALREQKCEFILGLPWKWNGMKLYKRRFNFIKKKYTRENGHKRRQLTWYIIWIWIFIFLCLSLSLLWLVVRSEKPSN